MKSKQYCSVCRKWLDMEVVSSGDPEDDDGVTWYRCPGCQGFLPKLNAGADAHAPPTEDEPGNDRPSEPAESAAPSAAPDAPSSDGEGSGLPWDSPQDMLEEAEATSTAEVSATMAELEAGPDIEEEDVDAAESGDDAGPSTSEPLAEYAAMLAEADPGTASPYRPWETYEIGQCVIHLAWDDCGVVVGKEALPGGRQVIKAYFADAGVVRLIENAPR